MQISYNTNIFGLSVKSTEIYSGYYFLKVKTPIV